MTNGISITDAIATLARAYHADNAMRAVIIHKLVAAGIIEQPTLRDPRAPCPPLANIRAIKFSLFDNGTPATWRGKEAPTKREYGLQLHAWDVPNAKVKSDKTANWQTVVPLWESDFALKHVQTLYEKRQVCKITYTTLTNAIARHGSSALYGVAFQRGEGSGWMKGHVAIAFIKDRKPLKVMFGWQGGIIQAENWSDLGTDQKKLSNKQGRPIYHARIAYDFQHADWCNDPRYPDVD